MRPFQNASFISGKKLSRGCCYGVHFAFAFTADEVPEKTGKKQPAAPTPIPGVVLFFGELFPRWDGEGARDSAPAPAAFQLLLLLLLLPLLPLLLLLLHQNHFSFSSHPEVNNPDSTITVYVYFLRTWCFRVATQVGQPRGNAT